MAQNKVQNKKTFALYGREADWKVFLKRVRKRKEKLGADWIVMGHTHIYYTEPGIINTGTYIRGDVATLGNYVIISDSHIASDSQSIKRAMDLLDEMKNAIRSGKKVVLLGDIFELWVDDPTELCQMKHIREIVNFIKKHRQRIIFIRGNHDYDIEDYVGKIGTKDRYLVKANVDGEIKKVYFYHGWEDDPVMENFVSRIWYYLWVRLGDNLYWLNKIFEPYIMKIAAFIRKYL